MQKKTDSIKQWAVVFAKRCYTQWMEGKNKQSNSIREDFIFILFFWFGSTNKNKQNNNNDKYKEKSVLV